MTDESKTLLTDGMLSCIGSVGPPIELPEQIGSSDVRRFVEVVGETNPLYCDDDYARHFGYRSRVVPPMLVVQLFRRVEADDGDGPREENLWPGLHLPAHYTNARNAGHEFFWLAPVYVGDRLTLQRRLTDIFVKTGRSGVPVIYLVSETEIRNQDGVVVVRQTSTTAKLPEASFAGTQ